MPPFKILVFPMNGWILSGVAQSKLIYDDTLIFFTYQVALLLYLVAEKQEGLYAIS